VQSFTISEAIEEAISRYPFNNSDEVQLLTYTCQEDFILQAPRPLIVHVFFNLIKNGLYYVQRGGKGTLSVVSMKEAGRNQVIVQDTGTGIPANVLPNIFDRFFSTTQAGQGAGIGLSFCKMVMESIGGQIECDSREGEYTTFILTFPAAGDDHRSA